MYFGKNEVFNCAVCGETLKIKSDFSALVACPKCGEVKHKFSGGQPGKVFVLPEDMSVIKLETTGKYKGRAFEVIGRYRIDASDGYYNLWQIHFKDGDLLEWIIECFGSYVHATLRVIKEQDLEVPVFKQKIGDRVSIPDFDQAVYAARPVVTSVDMQGELPSLPYTTGISVYEYNSELGATAMMIKQGHTIWYFLGEDAAWKDFDFQNIRKSAAVGS